VEWDLKNVSILCEVDRIRVRHTYNKTLSDWSLLRPPNFTLTVEWNYSTVTVCYTLHNTSIIYTEVWRITFIWEATALYFHIQYFYTGGKLTSSNIDTSISHQRRLLYEKVTNTEPPLPLQCYVVLPHSYLNHFLIFAFLMKIRQSRPFRISTLMCKNSIWKFRLLSSTAMTPGIIKPWRLIFVLEPLNYQSRKRFEVCITCGKVLSIDWTIFIIKFLNAFFIT